MIKFKHREERISPSKVYGIAFEVHPKGKSFIIMFGRQIFAFYTGMNF